MDVDRSTERKFFLSYELGYLRKYFKSRTFFVALALAILFVYGISSSLEEIFSDPSVLVVIAIITLIPLLPWFLVTTKNDWMKRMQRASFYQYKIDHPENIIGNKRITCFSCNNDRLFVLKVLNGTFMQEHVCTQCGKTLYYSEEGR